jgi:N-acetylmuramoyl-L-alanine amidase
MPAVLVEVGFISNPSTERELMQPDYLSVLARAIAQGISNHIAKSNPLK